MAEKNMKCKALFRHETDNIAGFKLIQFCHSHRGMFYINSSHSFIQTYAGELQKQPRSKRLVAFVTIDSSEV